MTRYVRIGRGRVYHVVSDGWRLMGSLSCRQTACGYIIGPYDWIRSEDFVPGPLCKRCAKVVEYFQCPRCSHIWVPSAPAALWPPQDRTKEEACSLRSTGS